MSAKTAAAPMPVGGNGRAAGAPSSTSSSSLLPMWMRQSLEHLSMKTNLEEYGTSPPESESLFLHEGKLPNYSIPAAAFSPQSTSAATDGTPKPSDSIAYTGLVFRAKDLIVPRAPRSLSVAQHNSSNCLGDQVCPSGPQSAATTPSVTPQHSPTLMRKILSADLTGAASNSHCKAGADLNAAQRKAAARVVPVTRVTNFDLNAVSPTSW